MVLPTNLCESTLSIFRVASHFSDRSCTRVAISSFCPTRESCRKFVPCKWMQSKTCMKESRGSPPKKRICTMLIHVVKLSTAHLAHLLHHLLHRFHSNFSTFAYFQKVLRCQEMKSVAPDCTWAKIFLVFSTMQGNTPQQAVALKHRSIQSIQSKTSESVNLKRTVRMVLKKFTNLQSLQMLFLEFWNLQLEEFFRVQFFPN